MTTTTTARVRAGAARECGRCHCKINRGDVCYVRTSRAVTYHEKCHADRHGNVNWYKCPKCACVTWGLARNVQEEKA